jgi:hypothetical protein
MIYDLLVHPYISHPVSDETKFFHESHCGTQLSLLAAPNAWKHFNETSWASILKLLRLQTP